MNKSDVLDVVALVLEHMSKPGITQVTISVEPYDEEFPGLLEMDVEITRDPNMATAELKVVK